jgi:hypothetical protein
VPGGHELGDLALAAAEGHDPPERVVVCDSAVEGAQLGADALGVAIGLAIGERAPCPVEFLDRLRPPPLARERLRGERAGERLGDGEPGAGGEPRRLERPGGGVGRLALERDLGLRPPRVCELRVDSELVGEPSGPLRPPEASSARPRASVARVSSA